MPSRKMSRRRFIKHTGAALATTGLLSSSTISSLADEPPPPAGSRNVAIIVDPADPVASSPPANWAISHLTDVLKSRNLAVRQYAKIADAKPNEFCIVAAGVKSPAIEKLIGTSGMKIPGGPETLALASAGVDNRETLFACGSDPRGLVYALLEVADRVTHADPPLAALETQKPIIEQPANAIRSISRLFVSDVEDLPWYRDKIFWLDYLNMLVTERFNRFNLALGLGYDFTRDIRDSYFYFPYPFFLAVAGYNVRAVNLPDKERDENLALLKFISDEAAARGLDFQLGLWCHAYKWTNSDKANYTIDGLNPDNHGPYCRDALAALLKACPSITGVTIRTHGESGVTEGSYDFWKFIFDGATKSGRKVEIDLHAKGIDEQMVDNAMATGMSVNVSPKYWAEHTGLPYQPASIRDLEKPKPGEKQATGLFSLSNGARRFMRYSYGDLMREDRKYGVFFRMWPGSMKLLLWGDPQMAAAWGRYASFCGSKGMEIQEPLSFKGKQGSGLPGGRNAYQDAALKPAADWEKYAYTYRLWGRLLYNPDTNPEVWRRLLRTRWQSAAPAAEQALSFSSRIIPLITSAHLPSAANANFWPEIYTNMSISDPSVPSPYSDTPSPKRFGTVSPLDPAMFCTIDEYAAELIRDKLSGRFSPLQVSNWLTEFADSADVKLFEVLRTLDKQQNPELQRVANDVATQIKIGRFFAHKIRAALFFALYQDKKSPNLATEAIAEYKGARDSWYDLADHNSSVYVNDITFGADKQLRGNWSARLKTIDDDLDRLRDAVHSGEVNSESKPQETSPADSGDQLLNALKQKSQSPQLQWTHVPPANFRAGDEITIAIEAAIPAPQKLVDSLTLHYRHVNQTDTYETTNMKTDGQRWFFSIPGAFTKSPYPLQYFFRFQTNEASHLVGHYPDLGENLCNQPYFVLRPSSPSPSGRGPG